MSTISSLGEFGLIRQLTAGIKATQPSTLLGVGDDCAIISNTEGEQTLVTTDMLMEGIHFDLVYTPLRHLGYKAAMVNLSDIYAMNGTPRQLLVSVAVSNRFEVEDLEELYAGLRLACVSGNFGAAYMGLQLMEREKAIYLSQVKAAKTQEARDAINFQPDFSGQEYLLERLLKPEARRDVVENLRKAGIVPTAMIDVSDGISSELLHICHESHVGCRIFEERLPIDYQTAVAAEQFNLNVSTCALNGGEDYELLFTVPLTDHERVEALPDVKIIGHITTETDGKQLVTRDGNEFALKAQGWDAANA